MSRFPATLEPGRPFVMKSISRRLLGSTAFVAVLVVQFPVTSIMAAAVLSSNMDVAPTSTTSISNGQWMAAPFHTTSALTQLTDVVLDVYNSGNYFGGDLSVEIWTSQANSAGPGTLVQSILQSPFSSSPISITGLSLTLQPDTEYAVVTKGNVFAGQGSGPFQFPGSLTWYSVGVSTHTGDGFVAGSWWSGDSGASWNADSQTMKMSVFAAVPEPSTYCMALAGLACGGYSLFRRRKRA
jgi:hypothetical protein